MAKQSVESKAAAIRLQSAVQRWIDSFSRIPGALIALAARADELDGYDVYDTKVLRLVASPQYVCIHCGEFTREPEHACPGCDGSEYTMKYPDFFPCSWGTLFAPNEVLDSEWLIEHATEVADLGIYVFESDFFECLLGIDGGGYDFYEAHWVPLYKLRGLQWHVSSDVCLEE
jgi:hypothetical protein